MADLAASAGRLSRAGCLCFSGRWLSGGCGVDVRVGGTRGARLRRAAALRIISVWMLGAVLVLAGCSSTASAPSGVTSTSAARGSTQVAGTVTSGATGACGGAPCSSATSTSGATSHVQVFVEPDAGVTPVLHAITGAQRVLRVEVYLLTDTRIVHALEDAAARGVSVYVLMEMHPYGSGVGSPLQTLEELNAAGVRAQASNPAYHYTHAKLLIVDDATAYILTANLSRSGLGGSSVSANREYGVIDGQRADVRALVTMYQADWEHRQSSASTPDLVISPLNSRTKIAAMIAQAKHSLLLEDEEMYDTASEQLLASAARRGVQVEVVLPKPQSGGTSGSADVATLKRAGVQVRYLSQPYMHAKLILADGVLAFVGSENFSATSLDQNREVGIELAAHASIAPLAATFARDWAAGSPA